MKKLLILLLVIVASVGTMFSETYSGNCGAIGDGSNLQWSLNTEDSTLTITGSGNMLNVSGSSSTPWYNYREKIKTAIIGDNVTSIGSSAFSNCTNLTVVVIGNNVTDIGRNAFYKCHIISLIIPNSVTSIGNSAFSNCTNLKSLVIGNSVSSIGESAFYNCSSLMSLTIPNSVTSIGNSAFSGCSNLTSITLGENITYIGASNVFYGCSHLTTVVWNVKRLESTSSTYVYNRIFGQDGVPAQITSFTLGESVEEIPYALCYDMRNLQTITIPNSVTKIGEYAFGNCRLLPYINIPNNVTAIGKNAFSGCNNMPVIDGCRYADTYLFEVVDKEATSISVRNGTKWIGQFAFGSNKNIETVTFPNTIISIEKDAFYYSSIASINFPSSLKSIGKQAFLKCENLTSITLPEGLEYIGEWAFSGCSSLEGTLVIPEGMTSISLCAFRECAFSEIFFPSTLVEIGEQAFLENRNCIENLVIPDNVTTIGQWAFNDVGIKKLTIGRGVTEIGKEAFYQSGWSSLDTIVWNAINGPDPFFNYNYNSNSIKTQIKHITVGEDVQTVPRALFVDLPALNSIEWKAKHVADLSYSLVGGVINIKQVTFTPTCEYIPANFCCNMTTLKDIYLPNTINEVGDNALVGCSSLGNIHFDGTLTEWCGGIFADLMQAWNGGNLLLGTDTLQELIIPEDINAVVAHGFEKCKSLTSVYVPDHVQSIGENAFSNCENVKSVILGNGLTSLPAAAFNNCKSLATLTLGKNIKTIYDNAFYGCENIEAIYNYREKPGVLYSTSFDGVDKFSCILYVPAGSLAMYKAAAGWKDFFDIREMGGGVETDMVQVVTTDNTATFNWNSINDAYTYTLIIWTDDQQTEMFCSLTFDASGYLKNINFGNSIKRAPSHASTLSGLSFTVTGLEENHSYNYELKALAEDNSIIESMTGAFVTDGQTYTNTATAIDQVLQQPRTNSHKFLRDGQIYILRGDKTYTLQGQEVK